MAMILSLLRGCPQHFGVVVYCCSSLHADALSLSLLSAFVNLIPVAEQVHECPFVLKAALGSHHKFGFLMVIPVDKAYYHSNSCPGICHVL